VQDNEAVPLTILECYKYCTVSSPSSHIRRFSILHGANDMKQGIYGIDMGCVSYEFYPELGTGAPRCDLFGGSVAQSLYSINPYVPNIWYDLGCSVPTLDPLDSW
jgi:hypothetical protein